jgi:hypothetical protein
VAREPQKPPLVSFLRARAFAARLDVDPWAAGICLPCLSLVVFPLDNGDEREALSWMRRVTPDLWAEGLEEYAVAIAQRARDDGVRDAAEALADLTLNGGRSAVARALVLRLAEVEVQRIRAEWHGRAFTSTPSPRAPPGVEPTRLR